MKILATTLVLSSLFFGTPVIAGSGHDHGHSHVQTPATKETAESNAGKAIAALVVQKKLDSPTDSKIFTHVINRDTEWLVIFINKNITDTEKQKLYVFLTLAGEYIAANFTGK